MKSFNEFVLSESETAINGIVDRKQLPQLDDSDYAPFEDFLTDKGVKFAHKRLPVGILQPTQNVLDTKKVEKIQKQLKDYAQTSDWWQFYVSHDLRILDGHHRWGSMKEDQPETEVPCVVVDVSYPELIALGHEYKGRTK